MSDSMDIINLTQDLGIIQMVRDKLVQQKDPTAEKLADVLDALAKVVGALEFIMVTMLPWLVEDEAVELDKAHWPALISDWCSEAKWPVS
jgi:hypothetical protein